MRALSHAIRNKPRAALQPVFIWALEMKKPELTQARLHELLDYDPDTGEFRWCKQKKKNHHAGDVAGCRAMSGYWMIHIDGRNYRAHRRPVGRCVGSFHAVARS